MKALVGAFNQEKALVGAFSVIVQPAVEPMDRFTALVRISFGYMSSPRDVDTLLHLIADNFVETAPAAAEVPAPGTRVRVTGLHVYPVKSCGGQSVASWRVTGGGLEQDRQWMVMVGGRVLTQKREPMLSQIRAAVDIEKKILTLSYR